MTTLKFESLRLDDIKPYERNPRYHSCKQVEQIAESIRRYGMVQPLVVSKSGGLIVGHGRYEALKLLKAEVAPVVRAENLTDKQVRALRLVDNKLAEMSVWDMPSLRMELLELDSDDIAGFDFEDFDFDVDAIEENLSLVKEAQKALSDFKRENFFISFTFSGEEANVIKSFVEKNGKEELAKALIVKAKG